MPSSSAVAAAADADSIASRCKRRDSRPPPLRLTMPSPPRTPRSRKMKQKRLDAIRDIVRRPAPAGSSPVRRSTRSRRPPVLIEPSISPRRTRKVRDSLGSREIGDVGGRGRDSEEGSRLRARGKADGSSASSEKSKRRSSDDEVEFVMIGKRKKVAKIVDSNDDAPDQPIKSPAAAGEDDLSLVCSEELEVSIVDAATVGEEDVVDGEADRLDGKQLEEAVANIDEQDTVKIDTIEVVLPISDMELNINGENIVDIDSEAVGKKLKLEEPRLEKSDERVGLEEPAANGDDGHNVENGKLDAVVRSGDAELGVLEDGAKEVDGGDVDIVAGKLENAEEREMNRSGERAGKSKVREGRRCGLCGCGVDGKPPSEVVRDFGESENEAYELSTAEEPNYDMWDGFGDEPTWLGPLLGPTHDRFGIARVWVHQNCAVWSPEVYFAGFGRLKNVRAALSRGKVLKCSRCGRPGATIGCRVDRCPRTYHLPCARAKGSIFDHRKFLIGCPDHRHLFEPHGFPRIRKIRKLKARKLRLQMRKLFNDASRKDVEAEEKWLENCGEDEEFLKREGKRLHRDLARIAPVYIGGDSLNDKKELYDGFESVAGLQDVIQCMKEVVILPLLYPEFYKSMGLTPPRGVLLHGYPGTGKTLVVRALIGACSRGDKRIAYFARKGADCLGKYVGDAERQLRLLFQVAERSQPSIIFFDEIDGLAPCRSRRQDQTHNSVVSTLLALLDGLKSRGSVMVIGATNRPDALDPALRRPGRFDREIYFPLPSVKDRASIMELHTKKWPKPVTGALLKCIAERTVGYAGADLQALCTQAVMMALKRQCALQELMSAAENVGCSKCPPLPSVIVEESDWLAALALAPPPCSRREAATCADDVIFVPLPLQLSQCLMYPVTHLLISLYLDERIWLPPGIEKASKLSTNAIFTALEQMKVRSASWSNHLSSLLQESGIAKKIENILCCTGLVSGHPYFSDSEAPEYDIGDKTTYSDKSSKPDFERVLQRATSSRAAGYRILLTGKPKCGQQHVAACLLHGFIGYSKVVKVSFATIIQEGHGDILLGITQILLRCMSVGRCIIYMPRIDLWAFEANEESAGKDNLCSETWKSFVEQVDARVSSSSLIILATCETHLSLPSRIKEFFTGCMRGSAVECTIPRFFVHFDGKFDRDMFLSVSTRNISHELVKYYVQLIHQRTHTSKSCNQFKDCGDNNARSEVNAIEFLDKPADADREMKQEVEHSAKEQQGSGADLRHNHGQDFSSRSVPNKSVRGKSNVLHSISTFGYQILRYPHFKELCWATSKLEGGPCADIGGILKGWPFNTCFVRPKPVVDNESSGAKNKENYVVRGLVAIGLLAYKGMYTSAREVSLDVRNVLELLVMDIDSRISAGKDKFNFLRLLAQVAYLDDMVLSWAYALRSSEVDSQVITSNTNQGKWDARSAQIDVNVPKRNDEGMPTISSPHEERIGLSILEGSSIGSVRDSLECRKFSEFSHNGLTDGHLRCTVENSTEVALAASASNIMDRGAGCREPEVLIAGDGQLVDMNVKILACQNGGDNLTIMAGSLDLHRRTSAISESCAEPSQTSCNMIVEEETRHFVGSLASDADNQLCARPSQTSGDVIVEEETRNCVGSVASNAENSCPSESLCRYICCSQCVHEISRWLSVYILKKWESSGCDATIEGMHDMVETCSLNLLAIVKASFFGENSTAESFDRNVKAKSSADIKCCSCPHVLGSNEASELHGTIPADCSCHPSCNKSLPDDDMRVEFFFRDSTLVPSDQGHDSLLHCRYDNFCTCFAVASILACKQPSE